LLDGGNFTVDGQNITGVRPFEVANYTVVTMQNINITGGNRTETNDADRSGGGIRNSGILTITNSAIYENATHSGGGGIENHAFPAQLT
ncbi:MAG: hypothetical protein GY805_18950, partial [Chloroflexi bacterium]|nr:hypothetical protein [Chloroflexota bacterium]